MSRQAKSQKTEPMSRQAKSQKTEPMSRQAKSQKAELAIGPDNFVIGVRGAL